MYSVGDKVVYPLYGAGTITDMEEKTFDGATRSYYVLNIPIGNLTIMISVKNVNNVGIRHVLEKDELQETMNSIKDVPVQMNDNWNLRYKENMNKIKTGDVLEVTEVFRNLRMREKEKGLSSAEKKVLSTAKQIILSEIILSYEVEKEQAEDILDEVVC